MNSRLSAMAVAISSLSLLAACGGGGPGSFSSDNPTPTAPTVTVTAPATATAGYAFTINWSSSNAASCEADFDNTDTSATASHSVTETTAGSKTYNVTCTGAGGDAKGSATVVVNAAAIAEGLWNGTTGNDRALAGVVTHPDATTQVSKFFLAYSQAGNHAVPAGFIAGGGTSTSTTPTDGKFASSSATNALREFNFEGDGAAAGSLTATYTGKTSFDGSFQSTSLAATWTFAGNLTAFDAAQTLINGPGIAITFTPTSPAVPADLSDVLNITNTLSFTDGGAPWTIDPTAAIPALSGNIVFAPYVERVWFDVTSYADMNFPTTHLIAFNNSNGTVTYNAGTRVLTWAGTFANTLPSDFSCTGIPSATSLVCSLFPPLAIKGTVTLVFNDASLTTYHGTIDWEQGVSTPLPIAEMAFTGSVPSSPAVTTSYTSTYNSLYETAPSLPDIQGAYTGNAGIDVATSSATFTITVDGSVTGTSAGCTYTGTAIPETIGNVFDITMAFSGGSCAYSGVFTGIATYGAKQVTVTAVNVARDKGFMFVGVKP